MTQKDDKTKNDKFKKIKKELESFDFGELTIKKRHGEIFLLEKKETKKI